MDVPRDILVPLAHGFLQRVASGAGVDVLHLKGPAVAPELLHRDADGPLSRGSQDADLLVRPSHTERLIRALREAGWDEVLGFAEGSAFGHAMVLCHERLGSLDLHRHWPGFGIDPETAFDMLWESRTLVQIAHVDCAVPALTQQRLILLLHAGRSGSWKGSDRAVAWEQAGPQEQNRIRELARVFDAQIALAAGIGELEDFKGDPQYRLWSHFSRGSSGRWDEWAGRWQAARGVRAKLAVAGRFVAVNPDLLRQRVGHDPRPRDYVVEYVKRVETAGGDLVRLARQRFGRADS